MSRQLCSAVTFVWMFTAASGFGDELWVSPTHKQDKEVAQLLGTYPVTAFGAARFGFSIPDDMVSLIRAVVVLIPRNDLSGTFNIAAGTTADGERINTRTEWLLDQPIAVTSLQLMEVDVTTFFQTLLDAESAGADYIGAVFWTSLTDSVLGLRFVYESSGSVNCWDVDEDFTCDASEDINGDGTCNANDCIGPAITTIAVCDDDPGLRQTCSDLCTFQVLVEATGACEVTSDSGSCGVTDGLCCVCRPQ